MKKIPTLYRRDWESLKATVLPEVTPGCEWVIDGEGVPYVKLDGLPVLMKNERIYRRYVVKKGMDIPARFTLEDVDDRTGEKIGWMPVKREPIYRRYWSAFDKMAAWEDGTYEIVGPKIGESDEGHSTIIAINHDSPELILDDTPPTSFIELKMWLLPRYIEGIIWKHPDGRMAKIKKKDFGLRR